MHQYKRTISSSKTPDGKSNVRHFLRDDDLTHDEYMQVLDLALQMKDDPYLVKPFSKDGNPESVAIIFDKNSTRTRVSFATGVAHLGGYPMIIDAASSQLSRGEPIEDTAHVLERMCSAIVWRTFGQSRVDQMASHASVPVVNALTDTFHPCQVLADLATCAYLGDARSLHPTGAADLSADYMQKSTQEKVAAIRGKTLVYLGDGANNMAHSYLLGCTTAGVNVRIACPEQYAPSSVIVADARALGAQTGASVEVLHDPMLAARNADIITTDAWLSMGMDKSELAKRESAFIKFQVGKELMQQAKPHALFLHCLPAYRDQEVTSEVIDGRQSAVFEEAEFRLHAQKALLASLMQFDKTA